AAGAHLISRQEDKTRADIGAFVAQPLTADEELQPVPAIKTERPKHLLRQPNGAAESPAVLVASHRLARRKRLAPARARGRASGEEAVGVEDVVLDEIVSIAMKLVRARFGLYQHDRAARTSELRRVGIGQDLKFLNRADVDALPVLIFGRVVVVDAVNLERR